MHSCAQTLHDEEEGEEAYEGAAAPRDGYANPSRGFAPAPIPTYRPIQQQQPAAPQSYLPAALQGLQAYAQPQQRHYQQVCASWWTLLGWCSCPLDQGANDIEPESSSEINGVYSTALQRLHASLQMHWFQACMRWAGPLTGTPFRMQVNHFAPVHQHQQQQRTSTPPAQGQSKRAMSREDSFDDSYPRAKRGRSRVPPASSFSPLLAGAHTTDCRCSGVTVLCHWMEVTEITCQIVYLSRSASVVP